LDKNVLVLAYLGDSVFEIYVRKYFVEQNINKVKQLQNETTKYVSAKGQALIISEMINKNVLTKEELEVFYRARNHKSDRHPKNTDIITYKYATGFEAVIGYLYLEDNIERINQLIDYALKLEVK